MVAEQELINAEIQDAYYLFVTNAIGVVSFTVLLWDHIITFDDEVAVVWSRANRRRNGPLIYLFILLRYFAPLGYTVQLASYFISRKIWTTDLCARYVVFEGCMTVSALGIVALMMMIRVYALYGRSWKILAFLGALFILQFVVQGWLLSKAVPVQHPANWSLPGCSMLFSDSVGAWAPASAWLPVVYDAVVFALTAFKTAHVVYARARAHAQPAHGDWIMKTLLRDGSLYFFVILISNVPLMIMISVAEPGIKNVMAQWEFLITVTMMSRITLSLRREDIAWQIGTTIRDTTATQTIGGGGGRLAFASDHATATTIRLKRLSTPARSTLPTTRPRATDTPGVWFAPTPIVEGVDDDEYFPLDGEEGESSPSLQCRMP